MQSDIYFSSTKHFAESEVIETSLLKRRRGTRPEKHIHPTSVYCLTLNSLVGTQLFESTGLATNDGEFATPARWVSTIESSNSSLNVHSTPLPCLTRASDEEKVKLRRKYSNAAAMATPVLSPILKPVMKRIDFGEDYSASNSDGSTTDMYPAVRQMSPVAASDPDLTRARSLRKIRLRSLFRNEAASRNSYMKQETIL